MMLSIAITEEGRLLRRHLLFLLISSFFLPLSFTIAFTFYSIKWAGYILHALSFYSQKSVDPKERILITSDNQATTLAFARFANSAGADVFAIDNEQFALLNYLRCSNTMTKFVGIIPRHFSPRFQADMARLLSLIPFLRASVTVRQDLYTKNLPNIILRFVRKESITTWIPCESGDDSSHIPKAKQYVQSQTTCCVFGPTADMIKLSKDHTAFSRYVNQLGASVQCPKTVTVTSRDEVHKLLANAAKGWPEFKLEREENRRHSGCSGTTLNEADELSPLEQESKIIPLASSNDTYDFVATVPISKDQPWIMHERVTGVPITVSALIVNNSIRAFIACVSTKRRTFSAGEEIRTNDSEIWDLLDSNSAVGSELYEFSCAFTAQLPENTNTHLNLHFILSETTRSSGVVRSIHVTGCDFKASPLLAQLSYATGPTRASSVFITKKETTLFPKANHLGERQTGVYSFPTALLNMVVRPLLDCVMLRASFSDVLKGLAMLLDRVAYWQEELFDWRDPWPWVWRWLVELPVGYVLEGLLSLVSKKGAKTG
jgi:hypothetical protein